MRKDQDLSLQAESSPLEGLTWRCHTLLSPSLDTVKRTDPAWPLQDLPHCPLPPTLPPTDVWDIWAFAALALVTNASLSGVYYC